MDIWERVYKFLVNKIGKWLTIFFIIIFILLYLYFKIEENKTLHTDTRIAVTTRQAVEIHKIDSARYEVRELHNDIKELKSDIKDLKLWVIQGNRDMINQFTNQLDYVVKYAGTNKEMIIDEIHNVRDAYNNTLKRDTVNLKIGVDRK
jgi:uncharacterized protein YlxW (UPF0749 family)